MILLFLTHVDALGRPTGVRHQAAIAPVQLEAADEDDFCRFELDLHPADTIYGSAVEIQVQLRKSAAFGDGRAKRIVRLRQRPAAVQLDNVLAVIASLLGHERLPIDHSFS